LLTATPALNKVRALWVSNGGSMAGEFTQRRLAAVMAADVVGYSRLMAFDETATLVTLKAHRRELIDSEIARPGSSS
jgi:adenylate cyclase